MAHVMLGALTRINSAPKASQKGSWMRLCSLRIHMSSIDVTTLGRSTATKEGGFGYDNCHVVPYNRYLSLEYQCHINVECCISIKSVKYIHKYIHKGHDCTTVQLAREG